MKYSIRQTLCNFSSLNQTITQGENGPFCTGERIICSLANICVIIVVVDSRGTARWVHNKFWPLLWRVSLSIREPDSICFLTHYQRQRKCLKRHCVTHSSKQRCLDSYRHPHITQTDCEISCNCGNKKQTNKTVILLYYIRYIMRLDE